MLNLDEFDKIFLSYGMDDEEVSLLEDHLVEEAKIAFTSAKRHLESLRKINDKQLSLPKTNHKKSQHLAKEFNATLEELRSSHLMLTLIKVGLYELVYMKSNDEDLNQISYQ